jgi:hypothetical protein
VVFLLQLCLLSLVCKNCIWQILITLEEDMVPEDLMSEPTYGGMMEVCVDVPDVGLELTRAASRTSSTLERGLKSQEGDLDCSVPMEVVENPSDLEVAATENPVPKDGASVYPAPEGVAGDDPAQVGSVSYDPAPRGCPSGFPFSYFNGCPRRVFSSTLWLHGCSTCFGSRSRLRGRRT